ncbi:MAG: HAMP domain-containing protein [Rhodospirillales bacterium]|jgi:methyl-accepting chemotaxis protein|nr:HAMP domain-containing protein [Rhodospirillales bacterium]
MAVLKNLRVLYQIGIIGFLTLIGFAVVGAIYFNGTTRQHDIQETQIHETEGVHAVNAAQYGFLDARRAENSFLTQLDMKFVEQHAKIVEGVLPHFAKLKTIHAEPSEQTLIDEMQSGLLAYAAQFNEVVGMWQRIGLTPGEGLRGEMRAKAAAVEEELSQYGDMKLTSILFAMRRHEKDFLLQKDMKFDERHEAAMTEFDSELAASSIISPAAKPEIEATLDAYMEKFDALIPLFMEEIEDKKVMNDLFEEVIPKLEWLAEKGSEDAAAATEELVELSATTFEFIMATIVIVTLIVIGMAVVIGMGISGPISAMTGAMGRLADGDLETHIPAQGQTNEIGQMAGAVQVFKENAIRVKEMEAEQKEAEKRAEADKRAAMNKLADDFESAVGGVVDQVSSAATEMQASSESMAATAEETSQQSATVATASEQASANVQTVASAAEELSSSISEISRQVGQSSEITSSAVVQAEQTNEKVQGLAEAANKIGEVVELITDIADQTNLLALNATIEAARAGDAGKGFAVVASEVKNLANQTGKATDEIGTQIAEIQSATQEAVTAIEAIGKTIGEVDEIAATIAAAVEQQGAATQEIARNVEQAAAGTSEVSSNIGGVNQAAGDTGAAATQIQSAASELSEQSETLRSEVGKFLSNVRTA